MSKWRIIDKAKVVQDTSNACRTGILVDGKVYELGGGASTDYDAAIITDALGYVPADAEDVGKLEEAIADKLNITVITINIDPSTYALTCSYTFDEIFNLCDGTVPVYFNVCVGGVQSTGSFLVSAYEKSDVRYVGFYRINEDRVNGDRFAEDGSYALVSRGIGSLNTEVTETGVKVTWGVA